MMIKLPSYLFGTGKTEEYLNRKGKGMNGNLIIFTESGAGGFFSGRNLNADIRCTGFESHEDAALAVAKDKGFCGELEGITIGSNMTIWVPFQHIVSRHGLIVPEPTTKPLLQWLDGPAWVAESGENVYKVFKRNEGYEVYINSTRQGGWYASDKSAKDHVDSWVPNLIWHRGPAFVAWFGGKTFSINKNPDTFIMDGLAYGTLDAAKDAAESWAQEQVGKAKRAKELYKKYLEDIDRMKKDFPYSVECIIFHELDRGQS